MVECVGTDTESELCVLDECVCTTNPCQDSNGVFSNAACNPNGGETHKCSELYDLENFKCLLQCECGAGYVSNAAKDACLDKNECEIEGTVCYQPGTTTLKTSVSSCSNLPGDYQCNCKPGYKHMEGDNKKYVHFCSSQDLYL